MLSVLSIVRHLHNSEFGIWYNMHLSVERYNLTFSNTTINAKLLKHFTTVKCRILQRYFWKFQKRLFDWISHSFSYWDSVTVNAIQEGSSSHFMWSINTLCCWRCGHTVKVNILCLTLISLPLYYTITKTKSHTIFVGERTTDNMANAQMMTFCV